VSLGCCFAAGAIVVSRSMPRYPGGFCTPPSVSLVVVSLAAAASSVSVSRAELLAQAKAPTKAAIAAKRVEELTRIRPPQIAVIESQQ
jgi:hypothetical protein